METPTLNILEGIIERHKTDTPESVLLEEFERTRAEVLIVMHLTSEAIRSGTTRLEKPITIYSRPDIWEWHYTVVVCPNGNVEERSFYDTGCDRRQGKTLSTVVPYIPPAAQDVVKNARMRTEYRDVIQGLAKLFGQEATRPA